MKNILKTFLIFLILIFLVTANCFASKKNEVEKFSKKYVIPLLGEVFSIKINPNRKQIAAGTINGYKVFDFKTGKELYTFLASSENIGFSFSPDGTQIMAPIKHEITIWDSKTGNKIKTLVKEQTYFSDKIDKYSVTSYNQDWEKEINQAFPFDFAIYSPDGKYIAAICGSTGDRGGYNDRKIRIWDVKTGKQLLVFEKPYSGYKIFYSSDGKNIGCFNNYTSSPIFTSFDAITGLKNDVPFTEYFPVSRIDQTILNDRLSFYWENNEWNYNVGRSWDDTGNKLAAFSPNGMQIITVKRELEDWRNPQTSKGKFYPQIFNSKTGELLKNYLGNSPLLIKPTVIVYNPNGTRIICGLDDGSIKIWDSSIGQDIIMQNYIYAGITGVF